MCRSENKWHVPNCRALPLKMTISAARIHRQAAICVSAWLTFVLPAGVATTYELSHIGVPPGPPTVCLQLVTPISSSHSDDVSVDLPSELQAIIKQQSWIYKIDLHHHIMKVELFKSQRVIIEEFLDLSCVLFILPRFSSNPVKHGIDKKNSLAWKDTANPPTADKHISISGFSTSKILLESS